MVTSTEAIRFELTDPRDGDNGVKYSFETLEKMEQKADELGTNRFQGITEENGIIQYVKKAGKWQRLDHREEEAKRLAVEFQSRIQADQLRDIPPPENLPSEVKVAFKVMGSDPIQDAERRASIAIEARHIAYADASIMAKNTTPDANNKPVPAVIPPEIAEQWAQIDARDFRKLTDEHRIEDAAIFMTGNVQSNAAYKAALSSRAPEIAEKIALLDAANNEKIALKEARKDVDARNELTDLANSFRANFAATKSLEKVANEFKESQSVKQWGQRDRAAQAEQEKVQETSRPATPVTNPAPADNTVGSDEVFTATQADSKPIVPPAIEKRYLRVGDKFYHPKNTELVAFEDKGNKLVTKSNSESIAESMVQIAAARGWDEIKVSGSETFRKQVWLEAASREMHVKGYSPSEQDKAELAKRVSETAAQKIEKASKPFRARENDPDRGSEKKDEHRNSWHVQLAETFANETAVDAVKNHPELAGAVAAVAVIDKQAEVHGLTPEQRSIVTARVRQNLMNSIERGEIPEVRLKVAAEARKEVHKEREYSR